MFQEFAEESEGENSMKQRIMKPEMMDEEVPSDEESHSEDGSLYDVSSLTDFKKRGSQYDCLTN